MTSFTSAKFKLNATAISCERLDGEMVIISFETGKYFNANGPAADLLFLIEKNIDQSLWQEILVNHFKDFQMESSKIDEFVSKLISENIILETTETNFETVVLPEDYQRVEWATPVLLVFNDLADLLLIDPIHDTSLDGWPMKKNE
jgi:hypothetical protein